MALSDERQKVQKPATKSVGTYMDPVNAQMRAADGSRVSYYAGGAYMIRHFASSYEMRED